MHVCLLCHLGRRSSKEVIGHCLHLCPRLKGIGMVSLNSYAIRAARRVGAQSTSLDGKYSVFLAVIASERVRLLDQ